MLMNLPEPRLYTEQEAFIDEIRDLVLSCGMTYEVLAEKCNVNPSTIQRLARGDTKWPRAKTLWAILDQLNYTLILKKRNTR